MPREMKGLAVKYLLLALSILLFATQVSCTESVATPAPGPSLDTARHRLLVQPDAPHGTNKETIKRFIYSARQSIYLTIYELEDTDIIDAMVTAKTANKALDIRVIFNYASFNASKDPNASAKQAFSNSGIEWKNADPVFTVTHQKTFTFDNAASVIMTFNLNPGYFVSARDFAVITRDNDEINEIVTVFLNDWATPVKPSTPPLLVWSPSNSRERIKSVIAAANKSLDIYMEEFNDFDIANSLIATARRIRVSGGQARVITAVLSAPAGPAKDGNLAMRQYLNQNGVQARYGNWPLIADSSSLTMYIHAKMILADVGTPNA